MVAPELLLLTGEVEIDEREVGRRGGRSNVAAAAKVAVAVEVRDKGSCRDPTQVTHGASAERWKQS